MPVLPPLSTSVIGSVPFDAVEAAVNSLAPLTVPAAPQLVKINLWEDMLLSVISGIPTLQFKEQTRSVVSVAAGRENALADFYGKYLAGDRQFLAMPPECTHGFRAMLDMAHVNPEFGKDFLKAQLTGPLTFGQSIMVEGGNTLLDDQELMEVAAKALGAKGAWLADQIRQTGRTPIIFLDEPGLTGYGSAFSTLKADTIIETLGEAINVVKESGEVLVGGHVCGNTDWGLFTQTGLDIVNLDAYEFLTQFTLYPKEIKKFLDKGGYIAWGVVPTRAFDKTITAAGLAEHLNQGWRQLASQGLDLELIRSRSLITPACGLGSLDVETAYAITSILPQVAMALDAIK